MAAENIKPGREDSKPTLLSRVLGKKLERLDYIKIYADSKHALATIGMNIDEHVKVAGLPVGYMLFVEIAQMMVGRKIEKMVDDSQKENKQQNLVVNGFQKNTGPKQGPSQIRR